MKQYIACIAGESINYGASVRIENKNGGRYAYNSVMPIDGIAWAGIHSLRNKRYKIHDTMSVEVDV